MQNYLTLNKFDNTNRKILILPKEALYLAFDQCLEKEFKNYGIINQFKYNHPDEYANLVNEATLSYFYTVFTIRDQEIRILNRYNYPYPKSFDELVALFLLRNQVDLDTVLYFDGEDYVTTYLQILQNIESTFIDRVIKFLNVDQFFTNPYMEYNITHNHFSIIITEETDYRIRRYNEAVANGIITE